MYISNAYSADFVNIIYNMLIGIASAIPIIFVLKDFLIENWKIFKDKFLENIIWVLTIGLVVSYGLAFVGTAIETLILGSQASDATNQVFVESLVKSNLPLMFIQSVILAPFVEEMLFRGVIFNTLRQKNKVLAHILSAFLFGLLHVYTYILAGDMTEWIKLIPYMATGLSLSYVYEKRQTIFASILLHMAKNLIAVLTIGLLI